MWQQDRPFSIALIVWVGGALLLFLAVHLPLSGPVDALRDGGGGLPTGDEIAKHYESPGGDTPAAASFARVEAAASNRRAQLDTELDAARKRIEFRPGPGFVVAPGVKQRGYEYTRIRDQLAPKLREMANRANVRIPNDIDPRRAGTALPREDEADELLFRLAITDRVVRGAVAAGVPQVADIIHDLGAPRGAPFAERRVEVALVCGLDELVGFIGKCSAPDPAAPPEADGLSAGGILVVRSATISREGERGSVLSARVTLAAITPTKMETQQEIRARTRKTRRARRSF